MHSHQRWLEVVQRAPLISIDLIVRDADGRVLLGLRVNCPARDTWFVPGGVVRKDETLDVAFARIAQAELGLDLQRRDARLLGVYEHFYDDNFAGEAGVSTHYVALAYEIRLPALRVQGPLEQHRELRLFTPEQALSDPEIHPNTQAYLRS